MLLWRTIKDNEVEELAGGVVASVTDGKIMCEHVFDCVTATTGLKH